MASYTAWYVLRTHPHQELRVEQNLSSAGIDVFLPRIVAQCWRFGRKYNEITALFPQYIFARFDPEIRLHDVTFTRGVQKPLRVGGSLAVLEDAAIVFLRSRMQPNGFVQVGEPLQPGERIIIEAGPFEAFAGVVERYLSPRERVMILLDSVSAPLRLVIDVHSIRRLPTQRYD